MQHPQKYLYLLFLLWLEAANGQSNVNSIHPLDPLSANEIIQCSNAIRQIQSTPTGWNFIWITLLEPFKHELFPILRKPTEWIRIPRKCLVIVLERRTGRIFEGILNLNSKTLEKWEELERGTQPIYAPEELVGADQIFRNDSEVRQRCARLGYTNMELVAGEPWAIGYIQDRPEWRDRRLLQIFPYGMNSANDNQFSHPLDFTGIVDVVEERVIAIENLPVHHQFHVRNGNVGVSVPRAEANYDAIFLRNVSVPARSRQLPSPNVPFPRHPISRRPQFRYKRNTNRQRTSNSVRLIGNELSWEKFRMRIGFNAREGLVLHDIGFQDESAYRPLMYRMALAEMLVPYADPRPPYHRKAVYDSGEYGLGFWAVNLQPGVDCTTNALFLDGTVNNLRGEPLTRPNAICIYEEETGVLFRHLNLRNSRTTYARNKRLVVSSVATVGNYDYALFWIFSLDGSIQFIIKATGLPDTELLAIGEDTFGYGIEIFPQVNSQFHQHHFAVRIDPMMDGPFHSVAQVDIEPDKNPTGSRENPYGNAFVSNQRIFQTVSEGCSKIDPLKSRSWGILTDRKHEYVKERMEWRLIPLNTAPLLMRRDSPLFEKAGFAACDLWVTPYNDRELYPGGFYLNTRSGLAEFSKRHGTKSIIGADVVLWHVFGLTHIPRAEDFPIMPIEETGFILRPHNFFRNNPSLSAAISYGPIRQNRN